MVPNVSVKGLKSFMTGQKIGALALGLFILKTVYNFVDVINRDVFEPAARGVSGEITRRVNIGTVAGINVEPVLDATIVVVIALTMAYLASKMLKVSPASLKFLPTVGL